MTIIDRLFTPTELPDRAQSYARDTVTLGWEARTHVHGRRVTDGGVELGTSLPRGTVLHDGDCFVLDAERLVVCVVARAEAVCVVEPRNTREWALFAYHIGNRHQPMMIGERALVCPDAPGVEQLLQQHGIPYRRATQAFTPLTTTGHHH